MFMCIYILRLTQLHLLKSFPFLDVWKCHSYLITMRGATDILKKAEQRKEFWWAAHGILKILWATVFTNSGITQLKDFLIHDLRNLLVIKEKNPFPSRDRFFYKLIMFLLYPQPKLYIVTLRLALPNSIATSYHKPGEKGSMLCGGAWSPH